jgi:hypothetical protein
MSAQKPKRKRITLIGSTGEPFRPVTLRDLMKFEREAWERAQRLSQCLHDLKAARQLWREYPELIESDDERPVELIRAELIKARQIHVKAAEAEIAWRKRKAAS